MKTATFTLIICGLLLGIGNLSFSQCSPALDLGPDRNLCTGSTLDLSVSSFYATVSWSTGSTASTITVSASDTISVSITDTNGCNAMDTIIITEVPIPDPDIGPDQSVCVGDTVVLDPGSGFLAYLWNDSAGTTDQDLTLLSNVEDLNREVIVRVKNIYDCAGYDTVFVSFYAYPVVNLTPTDTAFCEPGAITLAAPPGFGSYLWSNGDTTASIAVGSSGSFNVEVSNGPNCATTSNTANITVYSQPAVPMIVDLGTDFQAAPLLTGATYTWYLDSVAASGGTNGVYPHNNVPGIYYVNVISADGCPASAPSDTVQIPEPIEVVNFVEENIPELLTPNGDGLNETLQITDISFWPENELTIVNRYGQEVFKSSGYDNVTETFDGTAPNGELLPDGTYFYLLDLNDPTYDPFKGFIVISR